MFLFRSRSRNWNRNRCLTTEPGIYPCSDFEAGIRTAVIFRSRTRARSLISEPESESGGGPVHEKVTLSATIANVLRVRRRTSACGGTFSACGDPTPHAEFPSRRTETLLRMRNCLLGVRRRTSACGDALLGVRRLPPHAEMHFSACGDYLRMRRCTSRRAETTPACGDALLGVRRQLILARNMDYRYIERGSDRIDHVSIPSLF